MLRCSDGAYYVGHTEDLEARVVAHRSGALGGYTASRLPVELVWSQEFAERHEALAAELRVKKWSRAKKEALIMGDGDPLSHFAKPPSEGEGSASLANIPRIHSGRTEVETENNAVRPEPVEGPVRAQPRTGDQQAPTIVLVRPQLGQNIGKTARAMLNFGLTDLRLVEPRDGWPNPAAGPAAAGADIVLERARVYATTAEAVAECEHVYATTVRKRGVTKPVVGADGAARLMHAQPGRHAVLFGPERSGLETDDVALARHILTVPINPQFGSLNLAQAVILVAYEWSQAGRLQERDHANAPDHASSSVQPTAPGEVLPPAPQEELEGLIAHLETMLEPRGYFLPEGRRLVTRRTLRSVLTKPAWNHLEVRTLRGILTTLGREPRGN